MPARVDLDAIRADLEALPGIEKAIAVVNLGESPRANDPDRRRLARIVPVIPQDGQQAISPGDTIEASLTGMNAAAILFDIPPNVDATIQVDGNAILGVSDGQGRSGVYGLPDGHILRMDKIEIEATNNASGTRDLLLAVIVPR